MLFYVLALIMAVINLAALPGAPVIAWFWVIATALVPAAFGVFLLVIAAVAAGIAAVLSR